MCLEGCEEGLQERVTNYLQQEPHVLSSGQSRIILLQDQNIMCSFKDVLELQKDFKPIEDHVSLESNNRELADEEQRPSKRYRKDEDSSPENISNLSSLLDSLHDSHIIMKKIKDCNAIVEKTDRDRVKTLLQEMICTWEMKA